MSHDLVKRAFVSCIVYRWFVRFVYRWFVRFVYLSFVRFVHRSFVRFVYPSFIFRFVRSSNQIDERNERYTKRTNQLHERNANEWKTKNERMIHANKAKEKRKRYEISVNLNNPGSVLLTFLSNEFEIVSKNQSGFRKGFSTTDNIFIMHALVSIYFSSGEKLYCTFVDFRKAFDTVWRTGL